MDVKRELIPVASRWKAIGLALRLNPDTLDTIERNKDNEEERLTNALTVWLKKNYNVERFGEPSWQLVVAAVRDRVGGNNPALAKTIADKYCSVYTCTN